jgi:hypothetical protein
MADLGTLLVLLLAGAAALLGVVWVLLPYHADRLCPSCGAAARYNAPCPVCGAPGPAPPSAHPGAQGYGFPAPPEPRVRAQPHSRIEGGEAFNRGITRRVVTLATGAMGFGIAVRVVGMAGVLGLPQIPTLLDGLLTIAGGVIAFVGFVFLDAA